MKQRHRVLGMLALLSIVNYRDRVCIAMAGPRIQCLTVVAVTRCSRPADGESEADTRGANP